MTALLGVGACSAGGSSSGQATPPASGNAPGGGSPQATGPAEGFVPGHSTLRWHSCAGELAQDGVRDCTMLSVPLDYAKPGGRHISLALDMIPATAPTSKRQGILLVNPGGPGGSGLSLAVAVAQGLSPAVAAQYDIVGFDPRGVGSSVPALSCDPGYFSGPRPNYVPGNPAAEQVLINRARTYAAGCSRKFGWLLPHMTTEDMARDMDAVRTAFGVPEINYYAFSWGTYLGQVYATLFPDRVRRMVLDSVVDPTGAWYADNVGQDYAFQGRMNAFDAWAAKYDRIYRMGATAAAVNTSWQAVVARLAAHPLANPSGPAIGPDEFTDTFAEGAYDDGYWPQLAAAASSYLRSGSGSQLRAAFDEIGTQDENEFAVYNAVECADVAWPRSWAYWNSVNRKVYRSAPFETWQNVWYNAACAYWPVHGPAKPPRIGAPGLPGILMLQGTLDAATPYAGAVAARRLLPSARMVIVAGGGNHGQSLAYPPNRCVDGYLNRYLATGALPARRGLVSATCPALPDPVPSG